MEKKYKIKKWKHKKKERMKEREHVSSTSLGSGADVGSIEHLYFIFDNFFNYIFFIEKFFSFLVDSRFFIFYCLKIEVVKKMRRLGVRMKNK